MLIRVLSPKDKVPAPNCLNFLLRYYYPSSEIWVKLSTTEINKRKHVYILANKTFFVRHIIQFSFKKKSYFPGSKIGQCHNPPVATLLKMILSFESFLPFFLFQYQFVVQNTNSILFFSHQACKKKDCFPSK